MAQPAIRPTLLPRSTQLEVPGWFDAGGHGGRESDRVRPPPSEGDVEHGPTKASAAIAAPRKSEKADGPVPFECSTCEVPADPPRGDAQGAGTTSQTPAAARDAVEG